MAEILGQNATITFPWGGIKINRMRFRQSTVVTPTTGNGDGQDATHVAGVRTRQIAFSGIVINGVPNFTSNEGTITIDLTGDASKTLSGNCVMQTLDFDIAFEPGARILASGSAIMDGDLTIVGAV